MIKTLPDPAPITRFLRAKASSHLLVVAVHHFGLFEVLHRSPMTRSELAEILQLTERPAMVLFPALCAMGMLHVDAEEKLHLTELGTLLTATHPHNLLGYVGLEKEDPGVLELTQWLRHDGPPEAATGLSYVMDADAPSPMDDPAAARYFTLALAGRARYLAPLVAGHLPRHTGHLLDVAGGTGFYTYEWLRLNPTAQATLFDRPEVLRVAQELLSEFSNSGRDGAANVRERVTFLAGDMLTDPLPPTDLLLAASLFHDWPTATCQALAAKFAQVLRPGGELWVHDTFLDDSLDGPLAATDYSAMLFMGTKGRLYSRAEHRAWLTQAGLVTNHDTLPTGMDYGLLYARKAR
ncbi:SAM-dependent methyltransferase [Rhabdobacter roseus]|uniref:SAM-dependent methyltransferase n=1 Tax=Rhabdobacter roseus TaxID=1655419 RepID=A0A840TPZ1_9BACT|nr:methyltransferase [Rhabdobacter roseus]MBB5283303.1 SAM-dependent methyltransferase [Rhabdobacter roseus]